MIDNIFASVLLEFIGASIKWIFFGLLHGITGKKILPFRHYYSGRKKGDSAAQLMGGFSNILLALLFLLAIILIGERFYSRYSN